MYSVNRIFTDKFEPLIKAKLGNILFENDFKKDVEECTDLMVLTVKPIQIACRVRRNEYFRRYKNEFTIRAKVKTGAKTEISKIIDGFGDLMYYGFSNTNNDGSGIIAATLIDLNVFRSCLIRQPALRNKNAIPNGDGTSFMAYGYSEFNNENLIKHQWVCDVNSALLKSQLNTPS